MLIAGVARERICASWKLNGANNFHSKFMFASILCDLIYARAQITAQTDDVIH